VTEDVDPMPRNIYGVTKKAAEDLCELFHRKFALPCLVLRTSRFFPDEDDDAAIRRGYADDNVKVNEYLYRRIDIEDVVTAHLRALERAPALGFGRYIISATTPFAPDQTPELRVNAPAVLGKLFPEYEQEYRGEPGKCFTASTVSTSTHSHGAR
jgi:nucleoside-diphosphate-sugar epimerase